MTTSTIFRSSFFALALLLFSAVGAAYGQNAVAAAAVTPQISEFDINGMKVLVKRRPGAPTVAAGLYFRGGVRNTTAANAGIEALTLDAATQGSQQYPLQRLRTETTRTGTVISAGANYDFSVIALICTKAAFENSWKIFTDVALNPAFRPADIERIRERMLLGLRSQADTPEGLLETLNRRILFANHPYANDPQGTVESVRKLTPADLAAHHRMLAQTSRMLLVIVGDVEPAEVQRHAAAAFGTLPRGEYKDEPPPALSFPRPTLEVVNRDLQTNYIEGTFAAPSMRDADYHAMRVAMAVLQSRVYQEVRVRRNLSYAPDASLDERAANTGEISVSTVNPNEAVRVMLEEVRRMQSVDSETIEQMANYFLTTHYIKQETNAAQVADLAQYELIGGGWQRSLDFLDKMRAVTAEQVRAVSAKYMKNLQFVIVGNPTDLNRGIFVPELPR